MGFRWMKYGWGVVPIALTVGCSDEVFGCGEDEQCGSNGQCETNGYCSFPDSACPSGRRYGDLAGGGLANVCVSERDPTSGDSTTGVPPTETSGVSASATSDESSGGPPTPCDDDNTCDDGLACNGLERCGLDGRCEDGTPPCPPAPAGCLGCLETPAGAECTVVALDFDRDGFGSAECAAAPGDDCDDDDASTFPGAPEVCDGRDNDCNGQAELDDGMPLYGAPTLIDGGIFVDVAYSEPDQVYGLAYNTLDSGRRFTAFDWGQTQVVAPLPFPEDASDRVFLAHTGQTFAAVYRRGGLFINRQGIGADGAIGTSSAVDSIGGVGSSYGTGEFTGGSLGVVWERSDELFIRILDANLSPVGMTVSPALDVVPVRPRIARSETTVGIAWTDDDGAKLGLFSQDLELQSTTMLTNTPGSSITGSVDVVELGEGFAVAYVTGTASVRVEYIEVDLDGSTRCGPLPLAPPGSGRLHDLDAHAGVAAAFITSGDDWVLRRVRSGCQPLENPVTIEVVPFFGEVGSIDVNSSGVGIASQIFDEGGGDTARISFRALGPNLCDAPSKQP